MLFEIIREDEVVVFQEAETLKELEREFLLVQRLENKEQSFIVYKLDDDLNRIGCKKKYIPYDNDVKTQQNLQKRGEQILDKMFNSIFKGNKSFFEEISKNS